MAASKGKYALYQSLLLNIGLEALRFSLKNSGASHERSPVKEKNAYNAKCSIQKKVE